MAVVVWMQGEGPGANAELERADGLTMWHRES